MRKLLLSILVVLMLPMLVHAETENDYRMNVENHWYAVSGDYSIIDLHFILYTMDAAFTESDMVRDEWTKQIDDNLASELHEFFSEEELTGSEYNDRVLDYLENNFEIEKDDGGGFFAAIGNFFKAIFNFFANLF